MGDVVKWRDWWRGYTDAMTKGEMSALLVSWKNPDIQRRVNPINPGQQWQLKQRDKSPWPRKNHFVVTILDVKPGWVRYEMGSTVFTDERMAEDTFRYCYERVV